MARSAQLITPQGRKIELSADVYREVRQILAARPRRASRAKYGAAIQLAYGKYAGGTSLTRALLAERASERAREDARFR